VTETTTLGRGGPAVSRAGLGLRGMSGIRGENHARNLELLAALETIADQNKVTAAQLAIAWVASRGRDIIPLIGTKRRERLSEAIRALELPLSGDELAAIEAAVPAEEVAGDRYEAIQMTSLDSER
jgi:aryl-alcohol dehydrogenase-like predicted oxidoreductase